MGPLHGTKILELAGIGPGPFCAMLLADLGAEVLAVDRPSSDRPGWPALFGRGRHRVAVDLKHARGRRGRARPGRGGRRADRGVPARAWPSGSGIGPEVCLARNPRLVYGRMTGWGQDGPLARPAGHDINYIALSGALHRIGRPASRRCRR